jgi:hypothetical protein
VAKVERIDRSYLGEMLRLTLLAPDIVEAALNGMQPAPRGLPIQKESLPADWNEQCVLMAGAGCGLTR